VVVWNATTFERVLTLQGHTHEVRGLAFDPDGKRLATFSDDKTVKLWGTVTGQEALTLSTGEGGVVGLAFSPDRKRRVGVSGDGMVRSWDAEPAP
jgi:WD40 repeat protein